MNHSSGGVFSSFTTVFATSTHTTLMRTHNYTLASYKALQPQKAAVLWQLRRVILSREECHCNPLMLLSHPQRVWVSVPVLIYIDSGWRKWSLSLSHCVKHEPGREREKERARERGRERKRERGKEIERERGREMEGEGESPVLLQTSYKHFYNAFTMSAGRWHIGNQS